VKLFRGGVCEHPHEYAQIKEIYSLLTGFYQDQTVFMITNLRVNNGEIDCLLLRPNGPVILELKAYCGKIIGTENDRFWHVVTSSGKQIDLKCNLFTKLRYYRFDMMDLLKRRLVPLIPNLEENKKLGNISAWGYFERTSVYPPEQVNMRIAKWFNIVTIDTLTEQLEISNSGYTLFEKDLQSIVDDFHVESYTISRPNIDSTKEVHEEAIDHKSEKPTVQPVPKKRLMQSSKKIHHGVKKFIDFDNVWNNIVRNSGEEFQTKECFKFTYSINNVDLIPSLQGWGEIPRSDFEMAYAFGVCDNPGCYGTLFTGGKLIWAILHDNRINS